MCNLAYSFYSDEIQALSLPDFPVENLDKLARIMNRCRHVSADSSQPYDRSLLNTGNLLNKLYPFEILLREEETNRKFYFDLLNKFTLPDPSPRGSADYELVSVDESSNSVEQKQVRFKSANGKQATIEVRKVCPQKYS